MLSLVRCYKFFFVVKKPHTLDIFKSSLTICTTRDPVKCARVYLLASAPNRLLVTQSDLFLFYILLICILFKIQVIPGMAAFEGSVIPRLSAMHAIVLAVPIVLQ